jgi:hypothetical protein
MAIQGLTESQETECPLMNVLSDLWALYPAMRFGQLIEMVALLSGEEEPRGATEIEDDRLLAAAVNHLGNRRRQLQIDDGSERGEWPPELRAELLETLQRTSERRGDRHFGRFIDSLATSAGSSLYDLEDEELIAAARGLRID